MSIRKPDFRPETVYSSGRDGICFVTACARVDPRVGAALSELAWLDRVGRGRIIEEIVVAYCQDRFPQRTLPTLESVRYGEAPGYGDEDEDEDPEESPDVELPEGIRHFEHNELHWRSNGHRGRAVTR